MQEQLGREAVLALEAVTTGIGLVRRVERDLVAGTITKDDTADREFREAIWDEASGSLLIEEAGGRVSDLIGQPLDFAAGRRLYRNRGLVASNARLHDRVLAAGFCVLP
jgi:hypothetical protein